MGAKESKSSCITYDNAIKRVNASEYKRLKEAFKRCTQNGFISQDSFTKDVLGEYVPSKLAEYIYVTCGGTIKGISFKDLICGLVLITNGTEDEKCHFLFNLYSNESGTHVTKAEFLKFLRDIEEFELCDTDLSIISNMFNADDKVSYEEFKNWVVKYRKGTSLSRWLFSEKSSVSLKNELNIPTFNQTLAGVTHLEESDINNLERVYWNLKEHSKSGKLDLSTLIPMISPPLPLSICESFFNVFDENRDGHIDFKEMACGISAACRGPATERQKFCFKIFDTNRDGYLSDEEVSNMVDILIFVHNENSSKPEYIDKEVILEDIKSHKIIISDALTLEDYVMWAVNGNISDGFLNLIYEVCHIVFGLQPVSKEDEGKIVKSWLAREERRGYIVGHFWSLIAIDWLKTWEEYVATPRVASLGESASMKFNFKNNSLSETNCSHSMPFLHASGSFANSTSINSQRSSISRPGPINNNSLIVPNTSKILSLTGEGGKLKKNLQHLHDYELVPDTLWRALKRWYNAPLHIPRQVIKSSDKNEVELELYPITLRILRHQNQHINSNRMTYPQSNQWPSVTGGYGAAAFINTTVYPYMNSANTTQKRYVAHTATFSRLATVKHVYNYLCGRLKLGAEDVRLWKYYDENNMFIIEDEDFTLEKLKIRDDDQILLEIRNKDLTWPEEISSLSAGPVDKINQSPTERGATGLNNLGNTCFMNAALQCVSNTKILTLYFMKNMHLYEINSTNVLGAKGQVARRYGDLMHDIWSGSSKTIAPFKLRLAINKYAPQFSGFQQHDSHELLAVLLDLLNEDLNRVYDKTYVELKDSGSRPDVAVAQEAWENYILCNKSIIVDLFNGQLKSKVTCKKCGHESVRFDPFTYLSLPLPMESYVCVQCIVVRINGTIPMKFSLRLNAGDTYLTVRQQLSQRSGIPGDLLKLVQIIGSNIKCELVDEVKIKPAQNEGILYAYEYPPSAHISGSISGDEERLSITSVRSNHREAAQTFTAIQRLVRPGSQTSLGMLHGQIRTVSEDSTDDGQTNSSNEVCCSEVSWLKTSLCMLKSKPSLQNAENNVSPVDCTEMDEVSSHLTVDSGHCSASNSSLAESTSTNNSNLPIQPHQYIIAIHRKMIRQDVYFVSSQTSRSKLFGFPVIVPCQENTTNVELYQSVWLQVARFVTPLPPSDPTEKAILNHAADCDDSLGYQFPFLLKAVDEEGMVCSWCPWYKFCRGCVIPCNDSEFNCTHPARIAIDWDPMALHLRYQSSQENEYECIGEQFSQKSSEPLDLSKCLEAFITEEYLKDAEECYCSKCKTNQPATKKLQIWRLPPILIIHLKRFQFMNGKWVKSHKVVNFPHEDFDLTNYLAAVPRETINRYRETKNCRKFRKKERLNVVDFEDLNIEVPDISISTDSNEVNVSSSIDCDNSEHVATNRLTIDSNNDVGQKRKRLVSTSLARTPIDDTALQDFHQHRLKNEDSIFDLKYNLYSVVCHSGILGGGHYVSYAYNPNGKWYCYNDSSCREVNGDMDTSGAYLLFYERQGLDSESYMPNVTGKNAVNDCSESDPETEAEKKTCHVM